MRGIGVREIREITLGLTDMGTPSVLLEREREREVLGLEGGVLGLERERQRDKEREGLYNLDSLIGKPGYYSLRAVW